MSQSSRDTLRDIAELLRALRSSIQILEGQQLAETKQLSGHQTVDTRQSLMLSFHQLETAIGEMEQTLTTLAEATQDDGLPARTVDP